MGNSSSAPKATAQDKAILDLKLQRDKLHQYSKKLSLESSHYHTLALTALRSSNRPAALLALRRKKYHESLISKTDEQLHQLELLTQDVEFALVQKDVVYGLQQGTAVLKEIRKEMGGLEGVERLVGESEEEKEWQRELGEMLAGRMSRQEEDEVEDELAVLEREGRGKEGRVLPEVPVGKTERLPGVPVEEPVGERTKVEEGERERELVPA